MMGGTFGGQNHWLLRLRLLLTINDRSIARDQNR